MQDDDRKRRRTCRDSVTGVFSDLSIVSRGGRVFKAPRVSGLRTPRPYKDSSLPFCAILRKAASVSSRSSLFFAFFSFFFPFFRRRLASGRLSLHPQTRSPSIETRSKVLIPARSARPLARDGARGMRVIKCNL